ncbi:MAG TPA: hypothetical protein VI451_10715, partial [Anaerolineales bacterium]|nr:hypothetical protein [Anaerolineales bacterium]
VTTIAVGNGPFDIVITTLIDTTPPVLTVPADVTIECDQSTDPSNTGAATATDNVDPSPTITFSDATTPGASPDEFTLTRTWTATDSSGNSSSADQIITVVDITAPLLTVPADIVVTANTAGGYAGSIGTATATDNCDPSPTITNDAPGVFPLGDTIVTWTATDRTDNSVSATQKVTVNPFPVDIDIKPFSDPNSINLNNNGTIPVAILSTADFDATSQVDKTSLTFGKTGDEYSLAFCTMSNEDVNGDGLLDIVCHFNTLDTGFQKGDIEGILKGATVDGVIIEGRDSVKIVGGGK